MSIEVMNRIWWREDISGSDKWVLLALADASNDDGICWMAVDTIAVKAGLKRRAVQYTLKSLEGKRLVAIRRRSGGLSRFSLNFTLLPTNKGRLRSTVIEVEIISRRPTNILGGLA